MLKLEKKAEFAQKMHTKGALFRAHCPDILLVAMISGKVSMPVRSGPEAGLTMLRPEIP